MWKLGIGGEQSQIEKQKKLQTKRNGEIEKGKCKENTQKFTDSLSSLSVSLFLTYLSLSFSHPSLSPSTNLEAFSTSLIHTSLPIHPSSFFSEQDKNKIKSKTNHPEEPVDLFLRPSAEPTDADNVSAAASNNAEHQPLALAEVRQIE